MGAEDPEMDNTKFKDGVNRNARLIVRNISFKATEKDLKDHFASFGTVEEVKLLKKPDGKLVGCGFVHFTQVPMANKALAATNKKPFLGRPISVAWAVPKHKYGEGAPEINVDRQRLNSASSDESNSHVKDENSSEAKTKPEKKRQLNRKARLIIRNISFKATDDSLREHFTPYGELLDVKLLKKPDGKLVGCAFVHYKNVPMAKKALLSTNMKPFLGRPISVDWAVAKDKYMQHTVKQQLEMQEQVKQESDSDDDDGSALNVSNEELKPEIKSESEDEADVKSEKSNSDSDSDNDNSDSSDEEQEDSENEEDDDDDDEDENDEDDEHMDDQSEAGSQAEWKRIKLNDAEDGNTVFITNIPFMVDNDQLTEFVQMHAPVKYALVCVDKLTEHSKGSGFVKFENKEDADRFLSLPPEELKLEGQVLQVKPALKRENLQKGNKNQAKDNRNLYLVKEGVIVAGTKAAVGVSASDMAKRLALERSKTQMLKNLNRFVSKYRLVVANLPPNCDDGRLRNICRNAVGNKAIITEARVMRDLRQASGKDGKHPSKGFGFVMFMRHEDAIACLRKLNNNPDVFDRNNRPIVSFSIEDRTALNARKKRLEKSIANNPLVSQPQNGENNNSDSKKNKRNRKRKQNAPPDESYVKKGRFQKEKNFQNGAEDDDAGKFVRRPKDADQIEKEYTGLTAKQGAVHKMRANHKLRAQADLHKQNVKQEKKQSGRAWRLKMAAKERIKQPKQKINKNKTPGKRRRLNRDKYLIN